MLMISGWRRARNALGLHACLSFASDPDANTAHGIHPSSDEERGSGGQACSLVASPPSPPRSPSRFHLTRSSLRQSRSTCAICLEAMKPGQGHALFTAECSHTFHFSCIASNVRHGNLVCPVCRANWNEVPWQGPPSRSKDKRRGAVTPRRRNVVSSPRQSNQTDVLQEAIRDAEEEQRRLDPVLRILDESIANVRGVRHNVSLEPSIFDDDEPLDGVSPSNESQSFESELDVPSGLSGDEEVDAPVAKLEEEGTSDTDRVEDGNGGTEAKTKGQGDAWRGLQVTSCAEVRAVASSEERESFTVLIHVKAPAANRTRQGDGKTPTPAPMDVTKETREQDRACAVGMGMLENSGALLDPSCRAPLDLVTVLDVSGSMSGTKLALLKRAMGFVIRSLSPADRLAVIAFASTARRVMPLRRMVEEGRQAALRAIDSLVCTGGTNIAEGLWKGSKVLQDRRERNPVASIMLLSDGQDTYTMSSRSQQISWLPRQEEQQHHPLHHRSRTTTDSAGSLRHGMRYGHVQIPVHAFGFGVDHDATTMHSISEESGGTFSFIQAEGLVQDAFAQCIGGLLSVVVQEVQVLVSAGTQGVELKKIEAGSYESSMPGSGRGAMVKLGDLYAEEERHVLVEVKLPSLKKEQAPSPEERGAMKVLRVRCTYKDPVSQQMVETPEQDVVVWRPAEVEKTTEGVLNLEVEKQRQRLSIAAAIAEAGRLAEGGDLDAAKTVVEIAKEKLQASSSTSRGGGESQFWSSLETELNEVEVRMANRQVYERGGGRAYLLSAQSSHFRQRATTRGSNCLLEGRGGGPPSPHSCYQTPSMTDMLLLSQTLSSPPPSSSSIAAAAPPPSFPIDHRPPPHLASPPSTLLNRPSPAPYASPSRRRNLHRASSLLTSSANSSGSSISIS